MALLAQGADVRGVSHDAPSDESLGHVIYCSGVASGSEDRPFDAYRLHVNSLAQWLQRTFQSFLYLSSTKVYERAGATAEESGVTVRPYASTDVYAVSKIAGETLCLNSGKADVRVARLSNVAGPDVRSNLFFSDVMRQEALTGIVRVRTSRDSSKDYICIEDAVTYLALIALSGTERIYNVAVGRNTTHAELLEKIHEVSGARIDVAKDAPAIALAPIDVTRVTREFGVPRYDVLERVAEWYSQFLQNRGS